MNIYYLMFGFHYPIYSFMIINLVIESNQYLLLNSLLSMNMDCFMQFSGVMIFMVIQNLLVNFQMFLNVLQILQILNFIFVFLNFIFVFLNILFVYLLILNFMILYQIINFFMIARKNLMVYTILYYLDVSSLSQKMKWFDFLYHHLYLLNLLNLIYLLNLIIWNLL